MGSDLSAPIVRVAAERDLTALAALRAAWTADHVDDPEFEARMAAWLADEGDRRTTWLATLGDLPVGMASLFEYRRMPRPGRPDSRWGYVGNVFVRDGFRSRGIGSALLAAVITAADERRYARLVLSPSSRAVSFFRRAGFVAGETSSNDGLLVRPQPQEPGGR